MSAVTADAVADRRPRSLLLPALVGVVGLAMLVAGIVFFVRAHQLRAVPAADNDALVDASATSQVQADVSSALTKVLTYDYAKPAPTKAAADQMLRGDARKQYGKLFTALQQRAKGQKLVLTATVRSIGVERLSGNRATLLVFLDQTSTRATDARSSVAAAQVAVKAQKVGSSWRISDLRPL